MSSVAVIASPLSRYTFAPSGIDLTANIPVLDTTSDSFLLLVKFAGLNLHPSLYKTESAVKKIKTPIVKTSFAKFFILIL